MTTNKAEHNPKPTTFQGNRFTDTEHDRAELDRLIIENLDEDNKISDLMSLKKDFTDFIAKEVAAAQITEAKAFEKAYKRGGAEGLQVFTMGRVDSLKASPHKEHPASGKVEND